jgi:plasmid maintenance system antidote protein VapI
MASPRTVVDGARTPYKLTGEVREQLLEALRSGLTLREAAGSIPVSTSAIHKFCRASNAHAQEFAQQIEQARAAGRPHHGSRARTYAAADPFIGQASDGRSGTPEIMRMQIHQRRETLEAFEAAFLLGISVNQIRNLIRNNADAANSNVLGMRRRRRILVGWVLERPEIAQNPIAAVLAARLIEGRLEVPRPMSDSAVPEGHIVVLRGLL